MLLIPTTLTIKFKQLYEKATLATYRFKKSNR